MEGIFLAHGIAQHVLLYSVTWELDLNHFIREGMIGKPQAFWVDEVTPDTHEFFQRKNPLGYML
jgi:hypothetical protein